jgi:hypothetical protein
LPERPPCRVDRITAFKLPVEVPYTPEQRTRHLLIMSMNQAVFRAAHRLKAQGRLCCVRSTALLYVHAPPASTHARPTRSPC